MTKSPTGEASAASVHVTVKCSVSPRLGVAPGCVVSCADLVQLRSDWSIDVVNTPGEVRLGAGRRPQRRARGGVRQDPVGDDGLGVVAGLVDVVGALVVDEQAEAGDLRVEEVARGRLGIAEQLERAAVVDRERAAAARIAFVGDRAEGRVHGARRRRRESGQVEGLRAADACEAVEDREVAPRGGRIAVEDHERPAAPVALHGVADADRDIAHRVRAAAGGADLRGDIRDALPRAIVAADVAVDVTGAVRATAGGRRHGLVAAAAGRRGELHRREVREVRGARRCRISPERW
jgi:hypothetical protein